MGGHLSNEVTKFDTVDFVAVLAILQHAIYGVAVVAVATIPEHTR